MVASTALNERAFAEAKRLCYSGLDAPTLLREVAGRLRRVVPFEAYCATSNDPLSGLLTHVVHDGVMGEKEQRTYLVQLQDRFWVIVGVPIASWPSRASRTFIEAHTAAPSIAQKVS